MNNFQTILIALFIGIFVFSVLIFSGLIKVPEKNKSNNISGSVVVWGFLPESVFEETFKAISTTYKDLTISYKRKDIATYQAELVEAFANGKGPDVFMVDQSMLLRNVNFIYKIPFESYPLKSFTTAFVDGADVFVAADGIFGFPFASDPLVLYYNKDILKNEGIVNTPKNWDEFFELNKVLTKRDNSGVISQSMIALGQYSNVKNAKEIISNLLIQNGIDIVSKSLEKSADDTKNIAKYKAMLEESYGSSVVAPTESVLKFYLSFADVSNQAYSWNRSMPNSLDAFIAGKTAFYLGKASELFEIESTNPNLSFDVTSVPQVRGTTKRINYADFYGFVLSNKSTNLQNAFGVLNQIVSENNVADINIGLSLPPASRFLLSKKPADNQYLYTFFDASLVSKTFIDPSKEVTDSIFEELIENTISNRMNIYDAIRKANSQLELLLR